MAALFSTATDGLGHAVSFDRDYGTYNADPRDPRTPEDDRISLDTATDAVIDVIGRACRTFDKQAAADLLRDAVQMLDALADEVESGEVSL